MVWLNQRDLHLHKTRSLGFSASGHCLSSLTRFWSPKASGRGKTDPRAAFVSDFCFSAGRQATARQATLERPTAELQALRSSFLRVRDEGHAFGSLCAVLGSVANDGELVTPLGGVGRWFLLRCRSSRLRDGQEV